MSFYKMHRGWMENEAFRSEPYCKRLAFEWLIANAAVEPRSISGPQGRIALDRGQLSYSSRHLARVWKWQEPKVRRFLETLRRLSMIDAHTDAGQTIITICNYAKYQDKPRVDDAHADAPSTHHRRTTDAHNKNERNTSSSLRSEEGAGAPPEVSPAKIVFDYGVKCLSETETPTQARKHIGTWRKEVGDAELLKILMSTDNKDPTDRVSYIYGAVKQAKLRKEFGMGWRPLGVGG